MQAVIGIDIGGTKISGCVLTDDYRSIQEQVVACPANEGGAIVLRVVIDLCRSLIQQNPEFTIVAVGVGAAGQIDSEKGVVLDANENLTHWIGTPIAASIHIALNLPVFVENDVRTMALAEYIIGAGQGYKHLLCMTVGTGIGGAIIMNGDLWHGAMFSAGEMGYIRESATTTIESTASGIALEAQYQQQTQRTTRIPLPIIAQRALAGDDIAQSIIDTGAKRLGATIAPIVAFLNPQAVIVGGGVPHIGDLWWQPFVTTITHYQLKSVRQTPILKAQLGQDAGRVGAAILAWKGLTHA